MSNTETTFATIIIGVKHNKLSVVRSTIGTSGIIDTLLCRFEFRSTDWAGIQKQAVFQSMNDYVQHKDEGKYFIDVNEQGECYVPAEVLTGQGEFLIGIFGIYEDGRRISSNMLAFKCDQGCYCIGTTPGGTTPDDYAKIKELIDQKQDKLTAGKGIEIDENNVISCTCEGGYDDTELAKRIDENTQAIATIQDEYVKSESLAKVATTGSYNDLTDKPAETDLTDYATKQYVDDQISAIDKPNLDGYATEEWVENKGYLTEHQSLADYATKTELDAKQDKLTTGYGIQIDENNTISWDGGKELTARVDQHEADIATLKESQLTINTLEHRVTLRRVEIGNVPAGTLVNYGQDEVRVMAPSDTVWTANRENKYYMSAKLFAPSNAKYFREALAQDITDETYYEFENYEFSGIDEHGCKYSLVWLPMAEQSDETWTYTGSLSTTEKGFLGWYWHANWYDENKNLIGSDIIRINLSNESCHNFEQPYYMIKYATKDSVKNPLNVSGATAGQIVKIKTIDADGNPTEWEAIDIPSGSGLPAVTSVNGKTGAVTITASELIKSSSEANKVSIAEDGTLEVNALTFDKILQSEDDEIILSGGGA